MRLGAALLLLTLAGCEPLSLTRSRVVDVPDVTPMRLPERGWLIGYQATTLYPDGTIIESAPAEQECLLRVHKYGAAADYCGFTVYVGGESFDFDTRYFAVSWYYGPMDIRVEGGGDEIGADIWVRAEKPNGALLYEITYEVEHLGEIEEG